MQQSRPIRTRTRDCVGWACNTLNPDVIGKDKRRDPGEKLNNIRNELDATELANQQKEAPRQLQEGGDYPSHRLFARR